MMLLGKIRIPKIIMLHPGVGVLAGVMKTFKEGIKVRATEVTEVIIVTMVVIMVHILTIMTLHVTKGGRFQQVFGMLMDGILIKTLITIACELLCRKK